MHKTLIIFAVSLGLFLSQLHCLSEKVLAHSHSPIQHHHHHEHDSKHSHSADDTSPVENGEACCQPALGTRSVEGIKKINIISELPLIFSYISTPIFSFRRSIVTAAKSYYSNSPPWKPGKLLNSSLSVAANAPPFTA